MKKFIFSTALLAAAGVATIFAAQPAAVANEDHAAAIQRDVVPQVRSWLSDAKVVSAVNSQNMRHAGLTQGDVDRLDKQWRAEAKAGGGDLVNKVAGNSLSTWLKGKKDGAGGKIAEIFIMDAKGLNVGMSDTTSDYMQGDEGKHQKTFGAGADAVFIDEVEFDESSGAFQSQLSATISDGGSPIGAITVGVNVEKL